MSICMNQKNVIELRVLLFASQFFRHDVPSLTDGDCKFLNLTEILSFFLVEIKTIQAEFGQWKGGVDKGNKILS